MTTTVSAKNLCSNFAAEINTESEMYHWGLVTFDFRHYISNFDLLLQTESSLAANWADSYSLRKNTLANLLFIAHLFVPLP